MTILTPLRISRQPGGILLERDAPTLGSIASLTFFPAGSEIYGQGESCRHLYQVEFGAIRIYRFLPDGRRQIPAFYLAGEMFGFACGASHHFCAEAICGTGLQILRPPVSQAADEVLPMAIQNLVRAQEHLLVLGRQNAVERIAAFLLEMSDRQSGLRHVELPMSRSDIADYLGLTIETVSRGFSRLKLKGIIRLPSLRSFEIISLQGLQDLAE